MAELMLCVSTSFCDLPSEIVGLIAWFACTDGGRTGCSLALVSRYISEVTSHHRFHSILLLGRPAMCQFYNKIKRRTAPVFVRDLCLIDRRTEEETEIWAKDPLAKTVRRIMALLAPHLETLNFAVFGQTIIEPVKLVEHLTQYPLPSLTSLTLRLGIGYDVPKISSTHQLRMPQLRHLVHAGSRRRGWYELPAAIASLCPTVISLDLAEVDHQDILMLLNKTQVPGPGMYVSGGILERLVLALSSPVLRKQFPRTVAKTLLPPAERLCTRVEALHWGSTSECNTFKEQTGLPVVCGDGRTAEQWEKAWLADPCRLF